MAMAQSAPSWWATSRACRAVSMGTCMTAWSKMPAQREPISAATRSALARWPGVHSTSARLRPAIGFLLQLLQAAGPKMTRAAALV
jgi:hypothetical protein